MKVLFYGFGRIAISHALILKGLYGENIEINIYDRDYGIAKIIAKNLNLKIIKVLGNEKYDYIFITTPNSFHADAIDSTFGQVKKRIFVEKPCGIPGDDLSKNADKYKDKIYCGYVLRFSDVVQKLKQLASEGQKIDHIAISYNSNTITKKPTGWRQNTNCLTEMGSHIFDMAQFLCGGYINSDNYTYYNAVSKFTNCDSVEFEGNIGQIPVNLSTNWINDKCRKPIFSGKIIIDGDEYLFDQQKIEFQSHYTYPKSTVPFYLRGVEFTKQLMDFINEPTDMCDIHTALNTRKIIGGLV